MATKAQRTVRPEQVPPNCEEAEQAVLGAMLLSEEAALKAIALLQADDFYGTPHQILFRVIAAMREDHQCLDFVTILAVLKDSKQLEAIGGASYLGELFEVVPTAANVEHYARIVKEAAGKRRLIETCHKFSQRAYDISESGAELFSDARQTIESLAEHYGGKNGHELETIQASDLMDLDLPEPRWAIPNLLPEGLTLWCGRPKVGKSYIMLGICVGVAFGGRVLGSYAVEKGSALFVGLEDNRRRLQSRLKQILEPGESAPQGLHLVTTLKPLAKGGLDALAKWHDKNQDGRIIVLDTLGRLMPQTPRGTNLYLSDYSFANALQKFAIERHIALVGIHHERKEKSEYALDAVAGTSGLTGSADAVVVMRRNVSLGHGEAVLHVTGRDVEGQELAIRQERGVWRLLGDAREHAISEERRQILDLLRNEPEGMTPKQIAEGLDKNRSTTRILLKKMFEAGLIEKNEKGSYIHIPL